MSESAEAVGRARVPVEHRLLGLDKRTLPFALAALAVWALWALVVPWVNGLVDWDDPIRAGDVIQVTDDVTFVPAVGWGLESGLRTTDRTSSGVRSTASVALTHDCVQFMIQRGPWTGTAAALLRQVDKITTLTSNDESLQISGSAQPILTRAGDRGVIESFRSARVDGVIAAFVYGDQGLEIQAVGPRGALAAQADEIRKMIESLRQGGDGS
jgi:hypothetical protein